MRNSLIGRTAIGAALLLAGLGLSGCPDKNHQPKADNKAAAAPVVTFLVAASAQDAVREIAKAFADKTGIEVRISAGDSSKLAKQIVDGGAPADLFLSANEKWGNYVLGSGVGVELASLLSNTLVVIVPKGNPAGVKKPEDLSAAAVKHVAIAGPTVPAGIYAKDALTHLKLWDSLSEARKFVPGEDVRTVLTYVDRGEAEAGIVYGTDARLSANVESVYTFPGDTHDKIIYPLVLTRAGRENPSARRFAEHLQSPAASEVFRKYGFTTYAK